jgi:putative hydrolase of the HAD superfamily
LDRKTRSIDNVIFFDLDGTLLDDARATARGLDALHSRYGAATGMSRDELTDAWQQLLDRHFARYLAGDLSMQAQRRARMRGLFDKGQTASLSDGEADEMFSAYLAGYEHGWTCFADAIETLSHLTHWRLGVITNGERDQQVKKLERTGLASFFSLVLTSGEYGVAKPDARIFLEACARAGVAAADSVYVGDNWTADVMGSLGAGLQPIWLRRAEVDREIPPDVRVASSLTGLVALLVPARQRSNERCT